MGKESTAHAKAILTEFLSQCGGAQGAILDLKYGHFEKQFDVSVSLSSLKDKVIAVQTGVEGVLAELE